MDWGNMTGLFRLEAVKSAFLRVVHFELHSMDRPP